MPDRDTRRVCDGGAGLVGVGEGLLVLKSQQQPVLHPAALGACRQFRVKQPPAVSVRPGDERPEGSSQLK